MSANTEAVPREPQPATAKQPGIVRRYPMAFILGGVGLLLVLAIVALIVIQVGQSLVNSQSRRDFPLSPGSSSSCRGSSLPQDCAQRTLTRWMGQRGTAKVNGVQDAPQQNASVAQILLSDFQYRTTMGERTYSGTGTATFVHYNDGRWVLNRVEFGGLGGAWFTDINMEVQ